MSLQSNFVLMGRYNRWFNGVVYDAAAQLSPEKLAEDQGAFFGSVLGTLNHILVGDTVWLRRFAEHPLRFPALQPLLGTPAPASLDAMLHQELAELRTARETMDETILAFVVGLDADVLETDLEYSNTSGTRFTNNLGSLVYHFFNHQTHHRGQVTTLLGQNGIDVGTTDLLKIIRE